MKLIRTDSLKTISTKYTSDKKNEINKKFPKWKGKMIKKYYKGKVEQLKKEISLIKKLKDLNRPYIIKNELKNLVKNSIHFKNYLFIKNAKLLEEIDNFNFIGRNKFIHSEKMKKKLEKLIKKMNKRIKVKNNSQKKEIPKLSMDIILENNTENLNFTQRNDLNKKNWKNQIYSERF